MTDNKFEKVVGRHVYTSKNSSRCSATCRLFCFLNLHRWSWPGGYCECCGKEDKFFRNIIHETFKEIRRRQDDHPD